MATPEQNKSTSMRPSYFLVKGVPFTVGFKKEIIEEILEFMPKDGDIAVASYPKTGSTWMQYIVLQILTKGENFPDFNEMTDKISPFLEIAGVAAVEALTTEPRVYKHHIPYNLMKKNPKSKVIYVYRKPEDAFVSYYHFINNMRNGLDFNQYFEDFLTGNVSYGEYFEHILTYLEHEKDDNLLLVSYEKLLAHRVEEVLRVAKFLGEEYYKELTDNKSILNKIIEHTSFDYMKKNLVFLKEADSEKDRTSNSRTLKEVEFFRKGTKGDGKKSLSGNQVLRLKTLAENKLKGTRILREWNEDA